MISPLNVLLGLTLAVSTRAVDILSAGQQVSIDPNGAYVRACHLADGSILAGYTVTTDNGATKALPAAKSTDGGATWTNIGQVIQNQTSTAEIDNAFPLQLANGRILYGYRNHGKNPDGSFATYRITLSYSDDNGTTWSYLSDVDERQATPTNNGLWEPFIRVAANGDVQVYYSAESAELDQSILMKSSSDNGQTWSDSIVASTGATNDTRDGMAGVANLDDNGNLIMVFENTEIGPGLYSVDCVFSNDDGTTWTGRQRLFTPSTSAGAPMVVKLGDTLVTSFQTYDGVPSGSQPNMEVVTSSDNGTTWDVDSGNILATGILWPGLLAMDNLSFLALTGQGPAGGTAQLYDISA